MSQIGTPAQSYTFAITKNPLIDSLILKGLLALASIIATWAISHLNFMSIDPVTMTAAIFAVLTGIATAAWGWVANKASQAKAVNAGINLALAGASVNIPILGGAVTPLPATPATAQQIVKEFGDVTVSIPDEPKLTDALNGTQIIRKS
jgi:hypothetical protein